MCNQPQENKNDIESNESVKLIYYLKNTENYTYESQSSITWLQYILLKETAFTNYHTELHQNFTCTFCLATLENETFIQQVC